MTSLTIHETQLAPPLFCACAGDKSNQTMTLRDGRALGYAQFGDPLGSPVFFFHGGAGSRLEHPADVCAIGARIICMDRPGHGLSDFKSNRELLDLPDDVAQLADHLGIRKFFVLGWSAGGPHALACAYQMPHRVLAGAIAASPGPANGPGSMGATGLPGHMYVLAAKRIPLLIGLFRMMASNSILGDPVKTKQRLLASIPANDREWMLQSGNFDMWFADVREGYRQGWKGVAHDDVIIMKDWEFDISDIEVRIDIWHGDKDKNVSMQASEHMHKRIPNSRATFLSDEGHLFLLSHWNQVIQDLITD